MGTVCSLTSMRIFVDSIVELELHSSVDDGSIREVEMDGQKVIIIQYKGQVRAFSGVCPHQGGPLVEGSWVLESFDVLGMERASTLSPEILRTSLQLTAL